MSSARILYLSVENKTQEKIKEFFLKLNSQIEYNVDSFTHQNFDLINYISQNRPDIVFVDLSSSDSYKSIYSQISFIKRMQSFRSIVFAAILTSEIKDEISTLIFSSGFQLAYIKGTDMAAYANQCYHLISGESFTAGNYALARGLDLSLEVGTPSSLLTLSEETVLVETDIELQKNEETLKLDFNLFEDLPLRNFEIEEHFSYSLQRPLVETYKLKYPLAGAWDTDFEGKVGLDTIETWIDFNKDKFVNKNKFILVCSDNTELHQCFYEASIKYSNLELSIISSQLDEYFYDVLQIAKPEIIFIDKDFGENVSAEMNLIINDLERLDFYNPLLLFFGMKSKAEALQKIFNYENLLCAPEQLRQPVFNSFLDSYLARNKEVYTKEIIKIDNKIKVLDVLFDIEITALSEARVYFNSRHQVPCFSIIHFSLPVDFYVTIVPCDDSVSVTKEGSYSYTGIVHTIDEIDSQKLRKFVNQIIFDPIDELTEEIVEKKISQDLSKKIEKPEKVEVLQSANKNKETINLKFNIKGKSKL